MFVSVVKGGGKRESSFMKIGVQNRDPQTRGQRTRLDPAPAARSEPGRKAGYPRRLPSATPPGAHPGVRVHQAGRGPGRLEWNILQAILMLWPTMNKACHRRLTCHRRIRSYLVRETGRFSLCSLDHFLDFCAPPAPHQVPSTLHPAPGGGLSLVSLLEDTDS